MNKFKVFLPIIVLSALNCLNAQIPVVNGWSQFAPSADSRLIYVSDVSGNDATALHYLPSSPQIGSDPFMPVGAIMPYKTLLAAKAQLRNGFPDWILFKKAETWTNQRFGAITLSGRSATEPLLISAYGACDTRPKILTGTESFIDFIGASASHTVISGIHSTPHTYTGTGDPVGIRLINAPFNSFLVEDCFFEFFAAAITSHDPLLGYNTTRQNLKIRRCILTDAYKVGGNSNMFLANIDGILFEDNLIDHNGWNDNVSGAAPNAFSHNTYFQVSNTNLVFQNNIVSRASATGGGFRCGGTILNNLFLSNPKGIQFGTHETVNGSGGGINWPGNFLSGEVADNVVLDSRAESFEQGMGIQVQRVKNTAVHHNIVAHFTPSSDYNIGALLNEVDNVDFHHNIVYNWGNNNTGGNTYSAGLSCANGMIGTNLIHQNDIQMNNLRGSCVNQGAAFINTTYQNNRYYNVASGGSWYEQWFQPQGSYTAWLAASAETGSSDVSINYTDPGRNIATYLTSIGESGGVTEFIAACKLNSRCGWNDLFTASAMNEYIRSGFELMTPLPVELLQLDARYLQEKVQISWATATANQLEHFQLQRSSDRITWGKLAEIVPKLPCNQVQRYFYYDHSPLDRNFYRLLMRDNNGSISFSRIVAINSDKRPDIIVFPNPATELLHIKPQYTIIRGLNLINSAGQVILHLEEQDEFQLSIKHLPAGMYWIQTLSDGYSLQKLFIKT